LAESLQFHSNALNKNNASGDESESDPDEQLNNNNNKDLECKHKCTQLCHPGPCAMCETMVTRSCKCGRNKFQIKCSSLKKPKCELVCNKDLNCGLHKCLRTCHSGACLPCDVDIDQKCFSHGTPRTVKCGSNLTSQIFSNDEEEGEKRIQLYKCSNDCDKSLKCGNHKCEMQCHNGECPSCHLLPSNLQNCPCGQTKMREILLTQKIIRTNCLDPVPTCGKVCGKLLHQHNDETTIDHVCQMKCHTGDCGSCQKIVKVKCRCGKETHEVECHLAHDEDALILCDRRCKKKKSCGRHICNELCCDEQTEHICMLACNRPLDCGIHKCEQLCHRSTMPCQRCLIASFEERICECGATVEYPPIRCGQKPKECNQICSRQHDCDHQVTHNW
jgi:transcriptional repressor NF-X1